MRYFIILALAVIACVAVWLIPIFAGFPAIDDGYTALGALFSALAFAAVLVTLMRQHEDAVEQDRRHREELDLISKNNDLQRLVVEAGIISNTVNALASAIEVLDPQTIVHIRRSEENIRQMASSVSDELNAMNRKLEELISHYPEDGEWADILKGLALKQKEGANFLSEVSDVRKEIKTYTSARSTMLKQILAVLPEVALLYNQAVSNAANVAEQDPEEFRRIIEKMRQIA